MAFSFIVPSSATTRQIVSNAEFGAVLPGAYVMTDTTNAIGMWADNRAGLQVGGTVSTHAMSASAVFATNSGGTVGSSLAGDIRISVGDAGSITSFFGTGIRSRADDTYIENAGAIAGMDEAGISIVGGTADLVNSGTISGKILGVLTSVSGVTSIVNSGSISGESSTVRADAGRLELINSGGIFSARGLNDRAVSTVIASGDDLIENTGDILGDIATGAGADTLLNDGSIVGTVQLGDGEDTLRNSGTLIGDVETGVDDDAVVNSGMIQGAITNAGGTVNLQNTGTITDGLNLSSGSVWNGGTIGSDVPGAPFSTTISTTGSLTNTGDIFGTVSMGNLSTLQNSGGISGAFSFSGVLLDAVNTGSIAGLNATATSFASVLNEGTISNTFLLSGGSSVDLINSGSFMGGEIFGDGVTTVVNSGSVFGALFLDGG